MPWVQKTKSIKLKQYCNKFNREFYKVVHTKKQLLKIIIMPGSEIRTPFKHKPKTDALPQDRAPSGTQRRKGWKYWNKYFWLRVNQAEWLKFLQSCLKGTIHHEFKAFSHSRWQLNSAFSEILTRGVMGDTGKELKFEGKKDWGLYGLELWKRLRCIQESNKD